MTALAIYTAAASLPDRTGRRVVLVAVLLAALTASVSPGPTSPSPPLVTAAAGVLGHYAGARRRYTEALEAKNLALEQARHELARQAVTEERLRIARELHDVVAHSMSVVAVHAGSGRLVAKDDPVAAERALGTHRGHDAHGARGNASAPGCVAWGRRRGAGHAGARTGVDRPRRTGGRRGRLGGRRGAPRGGRADGGSARSRPVASSGPRT